MPVLTPAQVRLSRLLLPNKRFWPSKGSANSPCSHPLCPGRQDENLFALRFWVMFSLQNPQPSQVVSTHPQERAVRSHSFPTKLIFSFHPIRISSQSDLGFNFFPLHLKHQKTFFFFHPESPSLRAKQCGFALWPGSADTDSAITLGQEGTNDSPLPPPNEGDIMICPF